MSIWPAPFTNPFEAVQTINNNQVDLIFLDIVMPQITGPEFLKTLYNPPMVIFTTAFREYAAEGFECDAVDYLVKPICIRKVFKAVNKAFQLIKMKTPVEISGTEAPGISHGFLMVKVEYTTIRVNLNDISIYRGIKGLC